MDLNEKAKGILTKVYGYHTLQHPPSSLTVRFGIFAERFRGTENSLLPWMGWACSKPENTVTIFCG